MIAIVIIIYNNNDDNNNINIIIFTINSFDVGLMWLDVV